jgi:hypothetical protein
MFLKKCLLFILFLFLYVTSTAGEMKFQDFTSKYPDEQTGPYYFLYINDKPYKEPYIATSPVDSKELIYYLPARDFLNALNVTGTYIKEKDLLLINNKEFPKEKAALGRDIKTNEKILYLPFMEVLKFLNINVKIQENSFGMTYHVKTGKISTSPQSVIPDSSGSSTNTIRWYNSIIQGQRAAQDSNKRLLVKFGAVW